MPQDFVALGERLRSFALGLPEAYEESPWGHAAFKVKKKVFCFFGADAKSLGFSVKLPLSHPQALQETWAKPTGYGLGKSGWVSASFKAGDRVPEELLTGWIEESYRAMAPKKLIKVLDAGGQRAAGPPVPTVAPDPALAVVSGDPRRVSRAVDALAALGVGAIGVDLARSSELHAAAPDLVIVDFGRTPARALEVAQEVVLYAEIVAAGLRDAAWEKRVKEGVPTLARFREPPGDERVVAFVTNRNVPRKQQPA